jgi:hypothetical protein
MGRNATAPLQAERELIIIGREPPMRWRTPRTPARRFLPTFAALAKTAEESDFNLKQ